MEESDFVAIKCPKCGKTVFQFSQSTFSLATTLEFTCEYCFAITRIKQDFDNDTLIIKASNI